MENILHFGSYDPGTYYDEMFEAPGVPRPGTRLLMEKLNALPAGEIMARQAAAEQVLFDLGITFAVYGDDHGTEKIFPFDIIPRVAERLTG